MLGTGPPTRFRRRPHQRRPRPGDSACAPNRASRRGGFEVPGSTPSVRNADQVAAAGASVSFGDVSTPIWPHTGYAADSIGSFSRYVARGKQGGHLPLGRGLEGPFATVNASISVRGSPCSPTSTPINLDYIAQPTPHA